MAERNFWTIQNGKVAKGLISFKWEPGISIAQKRRSCRHLHSMLNFKHDLYPALDISSASTEELGVKLSAFNLKWRSTPVECWYQGSKVYSIAGPMHRLYTATSMEAKQSMKNVTLGNFLGFNLEGTEYPSSPRTVFYDWIYLQGMVENYSTTLKLDYKVFTDVQATLDVDACQARTVCIYKLLQMYNRFDVLESFDKFVEWHKEHVEIPYNPECSYNGLYRWVEEGKSFKCLDTVEENYRTIGDFGNNNMVFNNGVYVFEPKKLTEAPDVLIYSDLLLDDLCAIEYLSKFYKNAIISVVNYKDLPTSTYAPKNFNVVRAKSIITSWFQRNGGSVKVVSSDCKAEDLFLLDKQFDIICLSNATALVRDLGYISSGYIRKLSAMIGSSSLIDRDDKEWNAQQDINSYVRLSEYILTNSNCKRYSFEECERLHKEQGYRSNNLAYLSEYVNVMNKLNDSTACFDLQCVMEHCKEL